MGSAMTGKPATAQTRDAARVYPNGVYRRYGMACL